jgi:GTPase SAR1 family protein
MALKNDETVIHVFGNGKVGKSSLITKFICDRFSTDPTLLHYEQSRLIAVVGDSIVTCTIYEHTTRQNEYDCPVSLTENDIVIIMYDISNPKSFAAVPKHFTTLHQLGTIPRCTVLVGGKADLQRKVRYQKGKDMADSTGSHFFEASAKDGYNIRQIFFTSRSESILQHPLRIHSRASSRFYKFFYWVSRCTFYRLLLERSK